MKSSKYKNVTFINTVSSFILQIVTIINGFLIPKIILTYFGSNVNGLVSSLNQFLSYISLLEGGITGVVMANLYKPLVKNDMEEVSSVLKTTDSFYKKISLIFLIYSVLLSILYPLIFNVEFSWIFVFELTIVLAMNLFIQYTFALTYRTLLNADKKVYIVSFTQTVMILMNIVLAFISVYIFSNVIFLKFITGLLYIIQPIVYTVYVNKHYKINKNAKKNKNVLESRWNGFAINIAAFIHFSTDITILSIFTDLKTVSIYSVYALVTNGLRQLIMSLANGINPTIGHLYAQSDWNNLNEKFDIFEYIIFFSVFFLFCVAGFLITPFVMLYTDGVTDTNYNQPIFGILLLISEALYLLKYHHLYLSYSANKFKEITLPSYIEAVFNIVISLGLVRKMGIIGVVIGTIIAMIYRLIFQVYYTKIMISRKQIKFYKSLLIFSIFSIVGILLCNLISLNITTISGWIKYGILYSLVLFALYILMSLIFYKKEFEYFINKFFRKKKYQRC